MSAKLCLSCKAVKPTQEFYFKRTESRFQSNCKACVRKTKERKTNLKKKWRNE